LVKVQSIRFIKPVTRTQRYGKLGG